MKFKFAQNHTVIQTIKNKQTGASNRFVVCKFDENGELETNDPRIIHILQIKLPGCTWEGLDNVTTEDIKEILSDDELEEKGLKRYSEMSYKELQKAYKEKFDKSPVGKKKAEILAELEG